MNMNQDPIRSNLLMSRHDTALVVVDVQEKLLNLIPDGPRVVWNIRRLLDGAEVLGVPVVGSEQYPEKLGPTHPMLSQRIPFLTAKLSFSSCGDPCFVDKLKELPVHRVLVVGIETHVCVMQTVFDLLTAGYELYVAVDATAARFEIDARTALGRMQSCGVTLTTTETTLFEWCRVAGTAEFKEISQIVKRSYEHDLPARSQAASG
jgi:nicotinamidase-related amidase